MCRRLGVHIVQCHCSAGLRIFNTAGGLGIVSVGLSVATWLWTPGPSWTICPRPVIGHDSMLIGFTQDSSQQCVHMRDHEGLWSVTLNIFVSHLQSLLSGYSLPSLLTQACSLVGWFQARSCRWDSGLRLNPSSWRQNRRFPNPNPHDSTSINLCLSNYPNGLNMIAIMPLIYRHLQYLCNIYIYMYIYHVL